VKLSTINHDHILKGDGRISIMFRGFRAYIALLGGLALHMVMASYMTYGSIVLYAASYYWHTDKVTTVESLMLTLSIRSVVSLVAIMCGAGLTKVMSVRAYVQSKRSLALRWYLRGVSWG
jgi:hypothetical protein